MKTGVPPTARKARTGELTPPGMNCWAFSKSDLLVDSSIILKGFHNCEFAVDKPDERYNTIVVTATVIESLRQIPGDSSFGECLLKVDTMFMQRVAEEKHGFIFQHRILGRHHTLA